MDRIKNHKGVEAVIIVNKEGVPIRPSKGMNDQTSKQYAAHITELAQKARSVVRDLDPNVTFAFVLFCFVSLSFLLVLLFVVASPTILLSCYFIFCYFCLSFLFSSSFLVFLFFAGWNHLMTTQQQQQPKYVLLMNENYFDMIIFGI